MKLTASIAAALLAGTAARACETGKEQSSCPDDCRPENLFRTKTCRNGLCYDTCTCLLCDHDSPESQGRLQMFQDVKAGNDQCSIKVWAITEGEALSAVGSVLGSVLDGGSADDAANAAAVHGATCDAEPAFEGECRDAVAMLEAMPGVKVPDNYCTNLCSRSCYGGLWFDSPCLTDSEVIPQIAHAGPALFTVQIHCPVPWALVNLVLFMLAMAFCNAVSICLLPQSANVASQPNIKAALTVEGSSSAI